MIERLQPSGSGLAHTPDNPQDTPPTKSVVASNIKFALAYAVVGNLSVLFAIPPGYATVFWPAAGIALAAVLLCGYRVWPGIVVGSFLVNIWTGLDGPVTAATFIIPGLISAGAALQAVIGGYLARRFAGFPNALATEREVFAFMVWGGLIGCLVSANIGTGVLLGFGVIPASAFWVNLATWWIGDTVGVLICAPLVLAWLMEPREEWRARRLTITLPISVTVVLSFFAVWQGLNWERERLKLEFDQQVAPLGQAVEKTLAQYVSVMYFLEGFNAASVLVERDEFTRFVERPFEQLVGLQALSWNPLVLDQDRNAFEARVRGEGFAYFQITERDKNGNLTAAERRPSYVVVDYIEPFAANEKAFGFDVASNPTRKMALDIARDRGRPIATGRITLVQEKTSQFGLLMFMPVYKKGVSVETVEARRQHIRGYLVGVFRGEDLVNAALAGLNTHGIAYRLLDKSAQPEQQFLMENHPRSKAIFTLHERGLFGGNTKFGIEQEIQFGGRTWSFETAPTQEFLVSHRQANAWLVLVGGMLISSLVSVFVLVVSGRRQLLQTLVTERTADLFKSERRLAEAQRIAQIGNWDWSVGADRWWLSNEACRILGLEETSDGVPLETILDLVPPEDRALLRAALDQIAEAYEPFSFDHRIVLPDGRHKIVHQQGEMAFDENGEPTLVIGTIQDVTERQRLEQLKQDFVSTVSHELRTPLTSIKGSLGIVAGGALGDIPQKASDLIAIAHRNTDQLIDLVNDILDIGKFESGKMEFETRPLNLSRLVQDALDVNRDYALEYGVSFVLSHAEQNIWVDGDTTRLMQVMANLMSNAAKFSPRGGEVSITVTHIGDRAKVQVSDRGEGIPVNFRDRVFERFAQADSSSARQKGGTGLGLSISKLIVERHGGEIGFISEVGVGTSFVFTLPMIDKPDA